MVTIVEVEAHVQFGAGSPVGHHREGFISDVDCVDAGRGGRKLSSDHSCHAAHC